MVYDDAARVSRSILNKKKNAGIFYALVYYTAVTVYESNFRFLREKTPNFVRITSVIYSSDSETGFPELIFLYATVPPVSVNGFE